MKTFTTISALLLAISINMESQTPRTYVPRNQQQHDPLPKNDQTAHYGGNGWNGGYTQSYVSVNFGLVNPYPYNNYYSNGYSFKKAVRHSLNRAGQLINQAVAFDTWNDIYSPILAKAIRHYNYAQQLYRWGNYQAAHNHAERAGYLAWYSLQYFGNPDCAGNYNSGYYEPSPYSDPNNPYYRKDQSGGKINAQQNAGNGSEGVSKNENLDKDLPGSAINDSQLIKSFRNRDMKDE